MYVAVASSQELYTKEQAALRSKKVSFQQPRNECPMYVEGERENTENTKNAYDAMSPEMHSSNDIALAGCGLYYESRACASDPCTRSANV